MSFARHFRLTTLLLMVLVMSLPMTKIIIAFSPPSSLHSSSKYQPSTPFGSKRKMKKDTIMIHHYYHQNHIISSSSLITMGMVSSSSSKSSSSPQKQKQTKQKQESTKSATRTTSANKNNNNSTNSISPFYKVPHKDVLQRIQEIQRKDRDGENLSQAECDNILALCVSSDEWDYVLDVLEVYKHQNLSQIRSSYRACLQSCFECGNGESAKEILTAMSAALIQPEPSDIALTVVAMCRNNIEQKGYWRKALQLVKEQTTAPKQTTTTTKSSTTLYNKAQDEKEGTTTTKEEENEDDNSVNNWVLPIQAHDTIMECIKEAGDWKEAVRLLRMMETGSSSPSSKNENSTTATTAVMLHPAPELSTYRAAIECCVAANQPEQAVQILFSMKDRGVQPSTYTFEMVISGLSKKLQWRRALQILETMTEMDIPKSVVAYNRVIGACARAREVGMAKNLLSRMRKEGIRPDEVSFNSVIGACASSARWKDALNLLDQCYREPGVTPNIYIYTNAMRACAKGKQTKRALNLLKVVKDKGLSPDCYCYTAVIDACAKSGMWKKALSLMREMKTKGIEPTEVTYSVAISACGNGGQWRKALDLLGQMKDKGMSINLITYNAAITALSKAARQRNNDRRGGGGGCSKFSSFGDESEEKDLWFKALEILKQMKGGGIEPDGFCYSSAISCLGAQGRWKESLDLINAMERGGPRTRPNKIAYTAAINACGRAGETKHALDLFQNMKDQGLSADRVAYNALFSALRVAGNADKTFELWQEVCGTRPTSTTAIVTAKHIASPDIITVTDCIATLVHAERLTQVDEVFREAVKRGIILRGNNLDSQWETDLSGMSFPVARAACRYIVHQYLELPPEDIQDVTFITGVGRAQQRRKGVETSQQASSTTKRSDLLDKDPTTSLRDYVQQVFQIDFDPALRSSIPKWAQGTVVVEKDSILQWVKQHRKS